MATLGIDLSALSPAELQRLLESTRARGEAELTEQLVAELAARRARPQAMLGAIVASGGPQTPSPTARERGRGHPLPLLLLVASIAVASATFGWWLRQPGDLPAELPMATHSAASQPAVRPSPPPVPAQPAPPAKAAETPPAPEVKAAPKPQPRARPAKTAATPARSGLDCRKVRDRADRMVCASADLSLRHRQMRAAYDRAIAAGADRLTIDRGQAVWRDQRARAASRSTMAQLYTQRIRTLDAAAKQARQHSR